MPSEAMPSDAGVRALLGIPYGLAPVGERRFRAPVAASPPDWSLPYDHFGPAPVQAADGPFSGAVPGMAVGAVDEDCLTLNVWTPAEPEEALPVLVWIHGGAFVVGGTAAPTYNGARLAAEQHVVVVTVNYRVGAFGFLDLRSVSGGETADTNCGLRDQRLALQWVHEHIAEVGGDPGSVTVFGESGGAGSIMHLLTTPAIGGVIRSAIAQSPGIDFTQRADLAATVAQAVLRKAGVATVGELRDLTGDALLAVQLSVSQRLLFEVGTMVFHPVVDGTFVTDTPSIALAAGTAADIALVIGCTADEMRLFPDPRADDLDRDGLTAWTHAYVTTRLAAEPEPGAAARLVGEYLDAAAGTARSRGSDVWAAISADGIMRQPVLRVAETRPGPAPTFVYQLDWQARHPERDLGAFHAIDLPFVFDAFDVDGWGEFIGADGAARALGQIIRTAWAAFAATGDPSCVPLGTWPAYDAETRSTMVLDTTCRVEADPVRGERSRWHGLWDPACRPAGVPL